MHAERSVVIARPIHVIFDFLADGPRCTAWRQGIREITRMTANDGPGAVYRQVMSGPAGLEIDCDYLVTGFEPPSLIEFAVVAGPARPTGSFALIELGEDRSQVTFRLDAAQRGPRRLLTPLWARALRNEVAQLDRLKAVLEGDRSAV